VIDESTLSDRDRRRLREDLAVWLVTVRADGLPQPTPVWFIWDGSTFLTYSQVGKPKLRNIASNPKVALNFNSDADGEDVLMVFGTAALDPSAGHDRQPVPHGEVHEGHRRHRHDAGIGLGGVFAGGADRTSVRASLVGGYGPTGSSSPHTATAASTSTPDSFGLTVAR
jgi:PPOX class probable F420-dependent enzyme